MTTVNFIGLGHWGPNLVRAFINSQRARVGIGTLRRSGRAAVSKGKSSHAVTVSGLTSSNLVIATLQTHRTGVYVAAAVPTTGRFTLYLNKAVTATTYFAWVVLN